MNQPYLSELKVQIEVINQRLQELSDRAYTGALSANWRPEDRDEALRLKERKRVIQQRIINYEPPGT